MVSNKLIRKIGFVLQAFPTLRLAYLFGSQVNGHVGPISDIDLGVLIKNTEERNEEIISRLAYEVKKNLNKDRVDVILLNEAPVELAYAIISQGILIYQQDELTRVEYESYVMSRYGDYLPTLRDQREDILRGETYDRRVQWYREALERTERTLSQIKTT